MMRFDIAIELLFAHERMMDAATAALRDQPSGAGGPTRITSLDGLRSFLQSTHGGIKR